MSHSQPPFDQGDTPWPADDALLAGVADRLQLGLNAAEPLLREVATGTFRAENRLLSTEPKSPWVLLVGRACVSAGTAWTHALWPAAAVECLLAAADLLDDLADSDGLLESTSDEPPAVRLTVAAGLLSLGQGLALRAVEDGASPETARRIGVVLATEFARAADGQAASLRERAADLHQAYAFAVGKSGPLGTLAAQAGALLGTVDPHLLELYGRFGWHLAATSQLRNDARDASPSGSPRKADVRQGTGTVPLVLAASTGAPEGLKGEALTAWEKAERERIAQSGAVAAGRALAFLDRQLAIEALQALKERGQPTAGLRDLLGWHAEDPDIS